MHTLPKCVVHMVSYDKFMSGTEHTTLRIPPRPDRPGLTAKKSCQHLGWRAATVVAGALLIIWPALYNGYPLLYPDSMPYLEAGPAVARALFQQRFSDYYGMRSLTHSLGILPFHGSVTAWVGEVSRQRL